MWNILVVDDEPHIVEGMARLIEHIDASYHVIKEMVPEEALERVKNPEEQIDLLITDIRMPRMDGLELITACRAVRPQLPCVILSGYGEFEYAQKAISAGVSKYLLKPVDMGELKEVLAKTLVPSKDDAPVRRAGISKEVRFVLDEIENNYASFDLSAVASRLQLSRDYVRRLFFKEIGVSFSDYLTQIRIRKAKELLQTVGAYKVYEVCELVGYTDNVYFSKLFKKMTGMSPKEYQKYGEDKA